MDSVKLFEMEEIYKPEQILIDGDILYITDSFQIKLYSLKNKKYIRSIGRKGQGPGEFMGTPKIQVLDKSKALLSYTFFQPKMTIFNNKGMILKEKKFNGRLRFIYKISDNYVINEIGDLLGCQEFKIKILDKNFEEISGIKISASSRKRKDTLDFTNPDAKQIIRYNSNKLFVSDFRSDFFIKIYNSVGKSVREIKLDYKNIKINDEMRAKFIKQITENESFQFLKKRFKKTIYVEVPLFFPAIQDFYVNEEKIFVKTYLRKGNKQEIITLSFDGKILSKSFYKIPKVDRFKIITQLNTIKNNVYYYLKENVDEERFELHAVEIN